MMRTSPPLAGAKTCRSTARPRWSRRSKRRSTHDPEGIDPRKAARRSGSRRDRRRGLLEQRRVDRARARGAPAAAAGTYTIGFSNAGGVGNGWREAMICSVKAQAVASGNVSSVTVINHDTDAAGQLADIRDLIAKDVDAIIINPNDPDALNPAIEEAIDGRASPSSRSTPRSPRRAPTTCPTTRRSTPTSAPSGCSSRWARRATSSTCAASPATRPTPTATRASRRPWPSIPDIKVAKEIVDQVGPGDRGHARSTTS